MSIEVYERKKQIYYIKTILVQIEKLIAVHNLVLMKNKSDYCYNRITA